MECAPPNSCLAALVQQYTHEVASRATKSRVSSASLDDSYVANARVVRIDLVGVSLDHDVAQRAMRRNHVAASPASINFAMLEKRVVIQSLERFFDDESAGGECDLWVVYWTGHGFAHNGAWACYAPAHVRLPPEQRAIAPIELFTMWRHFAERLYSRRQQRATATGTPAAMPRLLVVCDSCHSGHWVEYARVNRLADVAVQSACSTEQRSYDLLNFGGYFSQLYMRLFAQLDTHVTREQAERELLAPVLPITPDFYVGWQQTANTQSRYELRLRPVAADSAGRIVLLSARANRHGSEHPTGIGVNVRHVASPLPSFVLPAHQQQQ